MSEGGLNASSTSVILFLLGAFFLLGQQSSRRGRRCRRCNECCLVFPDSSVDVNARLRLLGCLHRHGVVRRSCVARFHD